MANALGQFLKERRTARNWTLRELALHAGVGFATLSRWESGAFLPRLPEWEAVLDALRVSPAERMHALQMVNAPRTVQRLREEPRIARLEAEFGAMPHGGDLLRAMRYRCGLTLEQVAAALRVSAGTVSRWEQGKVIPPPERRDALFELLHAAPHERALLSNGDVFLPAPFGDRHWTRDALEEKIAVLWKPSQTPEEFQTRELELLTLRAQAWQWAAREAWGRGCLAQIDTLYSYYLSCRDRHAEARHYAHRALDLMPVARPTERFQIVAGLVAARSTVYSGAKPRGLRGVNELRHWFSLVHTPEIATWIRADMATYLALDGVMDSALNLLDEATQIAEDCDDADERQLRRRDKADLLIQSQRPAEALALLDVDAVTSPWMRAYFLLARVSARLALNDRMMAQDELSLAQSHIETYHLVHLRQSSESLARQL